MQVGVHESFRARLVHWGLFFFKAGIADSEVGNHPLRPRVKPKVSQQCKEHKSLAVELDSEDFFEG